jgi:predicted metal-dependent hydrolase
MTTIYWREQPVKLSFSRRKSVALHIEKGQLEIRAPYKTPHAFLQSFISSKDRWIQKTLHQQTQLQKDRIDYSYANRIPFMGIQVPLIRIHGNKPDWQLKEEGLQIALPDTNDGQNTVSLLADFYLQQAKFWLPRKTRETAVVAGVDHKLTDVRFRKTKTKWGHCTATGRIQYNWLIMMAPEAVIDYLVAHEVSHLRYMDHSKPFWQLVGTLHSSYAEDRRWLRQNEHRLILE